MQRSIALAAIAIALLPLPVLAQHNHGAMAQATAPASVPATKADAMSEGVVKKIDRKAGEVTITHGPLTNLGMGPMTMSFRLKSPTLIEGVKEGSRVRFVAENVNGELTVVALKAAK